MRQCRILIRIGEDEPVDLVESYDFHLIESPAMIVPPIREYDKIQYPQSSAAEMDRRTVYQPFDYKITLGYWGDEKTANSTIRTFFDSLFEHDPDSDVMTAKELELTNQWKGVKMKGFAQNWDGKTYKIEGEKGLITFEFTIYVNDPATMQNI